MYLSLLSGLVVAAGANAATHVITVGKGGNLAFDPSSVTAAVGDTLQYHFYSGSGGHSVVSSTFESPCVPNTGGFFSGYQAANSQGDITFEVNVTSTDPIWYYCSLASHCQEGMVGVVNAPMQQTLQDYTAAAKNVAHASAPSAMTGGVLTTLDGAAASSTMASTSTSNSEVRTGVMTSTSNPGGPVMTTTSGGSSATSTSVRTGVQASTTPGSATGSASPAATTTGDAKRASDMSVVLGLSVVMGALVMLMA